MASAVAATQAAERTSFVRLGTPVGSQMPASARQAAATATAPAVIAAENKPCSKLRRICVNDRRETHSNKPGRPAAVKSTTQDPIVTASAIIAAVAALSQIDAANNATAPTSAP